MGFSAANTGNNLIYLITAAMLGFMGVSGIFGKRNLGKVDITIESPSEVFAGIEFPLKITLTNNRSYLPGFLLNLSVDGTETLFPFVDVKTSQHKYVPFTFSARGMQTIKNISICSVFPFNFFVRCTPVTCSRDFVVFPAPKKCMLKGMPDRYTRQGGERPSDRSGFDSDIVSIRSYILGDPLKYISWKATARTGRLMTKELSTASFTPVLIDFDKTGIADIEDKISCITYSVLTMIRRNIPVGLKINAKVFPPGVSYAARVTLLRTLALLQPDN